MQAGIAGNTTLLRKQRRAFKKLTVMLPPDAYERLILESARRKIAGEPDSEVSSMMRAAIDAYFNQSRS